MHHFFITICATSGSGGMEVIMKKRISIWILLLIFIILIGIYIFNNIRQDNMIIEEEIDFPFKKYCSVQIDSNFIYASIDSQNKGFYDKLVKYNIKAKKYDVIHESEFDDPVLQEVMVNNEWITWLDANSPLNKIKIYCMNKKTLEKRLIYEVHSLAGNMDTPFLYKNYVSWVGFDNNDIPNVFLFDILENKLESVYKLNHSSFYNSFVHMCNNKLLWTDNVNDKGYYYILDLESRKINMLQSKYKFPGFAQFNNNTIFSRNSNYFRDWPSYKLGYYNIQTKEEIDFDVEGDIRMFRLNGSILAGRNKNFQLEVYDLKHSLKEPIIIIDKPIDEISFSTDGKLIYTTSENNEMNLYLLNIK